MSVFKRSNGGRHGQEDSSDKPLLRLEWQRGQIDGLFVRTLL